MLRQILHFFIYNIHYKILSLLIAALCWYVVQGEQRLEITRKIQINIQSPSETGIKGEPLPPKDATLSGPRHLLGSFPNKPLQAVIKVPKNIYGKQRIRIGKEYITNWDNRIKLIVHDAYTTFYVDKLAIKTIPIKEHLRGVPAEGFIIEKVTITPKMVTVTGLKTDVKRVKQIFTDAVDINELNTSTSFDTALQAEEFGPMKLSINKVMVRLQIGESKINRKFYNIPILTEPANLYTVKPSFVTITVQGTPSMLNQASKKSFRAFVDVRKITTQKKVRRKIQVQIPPETVLIETTPETTVVKKSPKSN